MANLFINGEPVNIGEKYFTKFHGHSVFTTLPSKHRQVMFFDEHFDRLSNHARFFNFFIPSKKLIYDLIGNYLKSSVGDQKIRIIVTEKDFALSFEDYFLPAGIYDGVDIIFSNLMVHPQLAAFKTGNSLPYFMAHKQAQEQNVFEALLSNSDGHVIDGSRTSIMHFYNDTLTEVAGGLDGIMRQKAMAYARSIGMKTSQQFLRRDQLHGDLLLSNSLMGVMPVGAMKSPHLKSLVERFRMD